ncbi:MAG: phospholipid carrier-dependent glycosyltransferase [Rhodoferax sp.]|nr:phospholipid carrier-dependent glycosyltransferase [Rhodoferax sp.]
MDARGATPAAHAGAPAGPSDGLAVAGWGLLLLLACALYALGLDDHYIPSNGDELVYAHIARATADSGHWLPLASQLEHMRNTKPPLLFWQALLAGDWGRHWSLAALRAPSVAYTLLTALLVAGVAQRLGGARVVGLRAAVIFLAFFSTYRFGRPYLTSAPETFWLALPLLHLLWLRGSGQGQDPGWRAHTLYGVALGLGLAYKSFALVLPAAAALGGARWVGGPWSGWPRLRTLVLQTGWSALIALGLFGLWFVLDPDPRAVWQEFVVGENAGKLADPRGYWHEALRGGGSGMPAQLLAPAQNAGLLAMPVLAALGAGLQWWWRSPGGQRQSTLSPAWRMLLVWLLVWVLVFLIPSQRSARYVIPAMPALALLLALSWHRLPRWGFALTLPLCALVLLVLGRIAIVSHGLGLAPWAGTAAALAAVLAGTALLLAALLRPGWRPACAVAASLAVYAALALTTAPLAGPAGRYPPAALATLPPGGRVAVPNGFNGQFERFRFLLPGQQLLPYDQDGRAATPPGATELQALLASHDAVVWLAQRPDERQPPCLPACTVLGSRWEIKGRQQPGEIRADNLWQPQQWLFRQEWLLQAPR